MRTRMRRAFGICGGALALVVATAPLALAHVRGTIWIGPGWYPPYYYPYYAPPPVIIQQEPQPTVQPEPQPEQRYWYYCTEPKGYYPYVKRCPNGWMKVVPSEPAEPEE